MKYQCGAGKKDLLNFEVLKILIFFGSTSLLYAPHLHS